jgi:hypothetical protein
VEQKKGKSQKDMSQSKSFRDRILLAKQKKVGNPKWPRPSKRFLDQTFVLKQKKVENPKELNDSKSCSIFILLKRLCHVI